MQAMGSPQQPLVQIGVPCQLEAFPQELESGPPSRAETWGSYLQRRLRQLRAKIAIRTRLSALTRSLLGGPELGVAAVAPLVAVQPAPAALLPPPALQAGDLVRVRSAAEIQATLDANGSFKGCSFGTGMYQYCGKQIRVLKVVERFFDEGRWRMLKARNMVLLEGVHCDGSSVRDTNGCDRMCFYFWRTEWLEKVEGAPRGDA